MKKLSMLLFAFAALAITSCSDKNDDNSQNSGATALATPVLSIDEASVSDTGFTVTWEAIENAGSYTYVVDNGSEENTANTQVVLTGLSSGSHTVKVKAVPSDTQNYKDSAWATINQTLGGGGSTSGETPESLQGDNYYVILLDDTSLNDIAGKVVADLRGPIYWWNEGAFTEGTSTGPNWRGELVSWQSVGIVAGSGWFGLGFHANSLSNDPDVANKLYELINLNSNYENYYLHMCFKAQNNGMYNVKLYDAQLEPGVDVGGATSTYGFARDGEWYEVEIPLSEYFKQGLNYTKEKIDNNLAANGNTGEYTVFAVTQSGNGTYPTSLDVDAVFIYEKTK